MKTVSAVLFSLPLLVAAAQADAPKTGAVPQPEKPAPAQPAAPAATPSAPVTHLKAPEAAKAMESAAATKDPAKAIGVLDVRTPEEFAAGHLKGAKNVDFNEDDFEKQLSTLDRNKTWLVHCAAGGRSTRSLKLLDKLGFKSIIHLDEGYKGWTAAGLPVEK
jgi:rhodanese-related sulfurtransferase